ncbi:uncharacterized protein LOC124912223 isoform X2 [Impatiens glandulifera]|uniref:uncharacterized protein LOC124912223 isoform X2 n=1 Tax=Impatiens glandulifera TaxID=253017 RepID=UPI001FB0ECF3|nr:uncharacterized protein LOC124912223 isoform X2 [Impatiens glandulifera]
MSFVAAAARSTFRSNAAVRSASSRLYSGAKAKPSGTSFGIPTKKPTSPRVFRSPVEMSSISIVSMLPFHTATASSLLTSMLSVSPRWTPEDG